MKRAAENLEFEEAATLRDEIKRLENTELEIDTEKVPRTCPRWGKKRR
jgi:excinuclease UvrABC nuclease subunit